MNVENISSAWRGNLSCEECSIRLNVFRKKKVCYFCKNSFCQVCITRRDDKKFCCRKCQILTARPLDRNKLLNLKSRDLINYLTSKQIPTNGCVEKEDLVNVLIRAVNNSCFHPSSTACFDSTSSANTHTDSNRSSPHVLNSFNDGIRIVGYNTTENETIEEIGHFETVGNESSETIENESIFNSYEVQSNRVDTATDSNPVNGAGTSQVHFSQGDGSTKDLSFDKPLMLSDIKSRYDLEALSVKQLKELLMRNRTDFKGCVERTELVQKVNRLWSDYIVSRKDLENLSLEELCKICMDAPIECVLLECGHMATCTSCGKQLCECPICRQFVVRCVRTFKA